MRLHQDAAKRSGSGTRSGTERPLVNATVKRRDEIATMELPDVFTAVRPSIVAFASRLVRKKDPSAPLLPQFIGTGFFVDRRGLVATNRHVVEALRALPIHPEEGYPAAMALVFTESARGDGGSEVGCMGVGIRQYWPLTTFNAPEYYYGDPLPDVAWVQLEVQEVPPLELSAEPWVIKVGTSVATAGFPLGDAALTAYKSINQITPTLRHGIVSSVFPFPCAHPHGFTIDVTSQGGASGSPIFLASQPTVVGLLHAGFDGTNFTFAVPGSILKGALDSLLQTVTINLDGVKTLEALKARGIQPFEWQRRRTSAAPDGSEVDGTPSGRG